MNKWIIMSMALFLALTACKPKQEEEPESTTSEVTSGDFNWNPDNFDDKRILRYQIPGFDSLSLNQKKLVYYLTQAGLAGRDIMYDQNYRHNLAIRHALEKVISNFNGDRNSADWAAVEDYAKNVWFSSGIHHHYSNDKFVPGFSREYFEGLMQESGATLDDESLRAIFDPAFDAVKIDQREGVDVVKSSAVNFYAPDITQAEVEAFYKQKKQNMADPDKVEIGLNSRIVRGEGGKLEEQVIKADGLYGPAVRQMIGWLEKAVEVAENQPQADALRALIKYYQTGDLADWSAFNIAWVKATDGDIDYITGFVEVYQDPLGLKGSFETIVQIKDFEASARMEKVAAQAQWFEDHAPLMEQHKKKQVMGIAYRVVNVAGESGDASPATPIGVNLPNADWIRKEYGSKSVSLGNILHAYSSAEGPGMTSEFANDEEELELGKKYGDLAGDLHTALHEVLGHASGQLEPGVNPSEALKQYFSPLEEGRADLFALYYMMDPKMEELGLLPSPDAAKAEYDSYMRNGLMLQLRRIKPGKSIEEAHMRNRAMIARWVLDKGGPEVVTMAKRDGKTYVDIKDYNKMRDLFGQLLREVQRIKSQGDFEAAKNLFETYGVKVDPALHAEVLERASKLNIPPYSGFINPKLTPVMGEGGQITDIKVEYPEDFIQQMLEYGRDYNFLQ
ncbi:MAG: dihydrofolate reductase [Lewinellaceae bacterium]|nr:dihydrofolate reductase [Lewinella sp.]MCB9280225.1 dihydrofolate reductase [Lewinellaceae bacterium]